MATSELFRVTFSCTLGPQKVRTYHVVQVTTVNQRLEVTFTHQLAETFAGDDYRCGNSWSHDFPFNDTTATIMTTTIRLVGLKTCSARMIMSLFRF